MKRKLRAARATVICPDAFAKKGIGYFAYAISEGFKCNLISNERFQMNSLDIQYDASFLYNSDYHSDGVLPQTKRKLQQMPFPKRGLLEFKEHIVEQASDNPLLVFVSDEKVKNFEIQSLNSSLSQKNDLFAWLHQLNRATYIITISQARLDNYMFFDLIAEVAHQIKTDKILAVRRV